MTEQKFELTKDWPHGYVDVVDRPHKVIFWGTRCIVSQLADDDSYEWIWTGQGRSYANLDDPNHLRNAPAPKRSGTVWIAVHQTYRDGPFHFVAHDAEGFPKGNAIAVKRVDWTEGDGL